MRLLLANLVLIAGVTLGLVSWPVHSRAPACIRTASAKPPHPLSDRYGDPLPAGALDRLGTVRLRHLEFVASLAWSPDGRILASGGDPLLGLEPICLWEMASGKLLRRFGKDKSAFQLAFSPSGTFLASAGADDEGLRLWRVATGKEVRQFKTRSRAWAIAFSPDGKTLGGGCENGTVYLWQVATGKQMCQLAGHGDGVGAVAFSPDGKTVASGGDADPMVRLWQVASGKQLRRFVDHRAGIRTVAFSSDGKALTTVTEVGAVYQLETATGKVLHRSQGQNDLRWLFALSADGRSLALGGLGRTIELTEVPTGRILRMVGGNGRVSALAFAPDGRSLALGNDYGTVSVWETATGQPRHRFAGHQAAIFSLAISPAGKVLATNSVDNVTILWDISSGEETGRMGEDFDADSLAFSGERILALAGTKGEILIWDIPAGKPLRRWQGHQERIHSVAFSPDGKTLATGSDDETVRLWEVATSKELRLLEHRSWVTSVAFSPDGKMLAAAQNHPAIFLWDIATGKRRGKLVGSSTSTSSVAFSPDSRSLASGGEDGTVQLWDLATGKKVREFHGHFKEVRLVAFSPDGKMVAAPGGKSVILWRTATGKTLHEFTGHQNTIWGMAFAPDGKILVTASGDGTVLVWDLAGRGEVRHRRKVGPSGRSLDACWADLVSKDAAQAYRATRSLIDRPEPTTAFLKSRLHPVPVADGKKVARLLARLDSKRFTTRRSATREMEGLGGEVEPALRKALKGRLEAGVRRKLKQILQKIEALTGERLRLHRALEVLEYIGKAKARTMLEKLARGAPGAWLTREATASLERLDRRLVSNGK